MRPLRVAELLLDTAIDAVRVRRGPLPPKVRTPAIYTRAALGWRLPYVVALVLDTPEFATR